MCTVGSVSVWPGVVNVIPGSVNFTVDIRYVYDTWHQHDRVVWHIVAVVEVALTRLMPQEWGRCIEVDGRGSSGVVGRDDMHASSADVCDARNPCIAHRAL